MNKEIKFRAWDKIQKKIIVPEIISFTEQIFKERSNSFIRPLKEIVLLQYTGLKDKRGVEDRHKNILQDTLTKLICTVEYGQYKSKNGTGFGWYLQKLNGEAYIPYPYTLEDWEIIGNSLENKELLK